MSHNRRAFTLIELLVVIAIIAILAAILFPVFAQAKAAAKQSACLSNAKQYNMATQMYLGDFDDCAPLINWTNSYDANPARTDRDQAIGNIVQPYIKNYPMFNSPASPVGDADRDRDLINPSSTTYKLQQYQFNRAIKADYGYNTEYFSRMGYDTTRPNQFHPGGTLWSIVSNPANTLLFVNSVWDRTASGAPQGGGNWGLDMPCRWYSDGSDSLPPVPAGSTGYWWFGGWNPNAPMAWNVYGGVWPYHRSNLVANVSFADGHAKGMRVPEISAGCDVQPGWQGYIFDREKYIWDLQ